LVQRCRQALSDHLVAGLAATFSAADEALFGCAESSANNQVQSLFFDAMREVRRLRPTIERDYHRQVAAGFSAFAARQPGAAAMPPAALELVSSDDYEEDLRVSGMAGRLKARCTGDLHALEQRLALLNRGVKFAEDSNPFGPTVLARAFRRALAPCGLPLPARLVLYDVFEAQTMQRLDAFYRQLNETLVAAGVLPNLRLRGHTGAAPRAPQSRSVAEVSGEGEGERLLQELGDLLRSVRAGEGAPESTADEGAALRPEALMAALDRLQEGDEDALRGAPEGTRGVPARGAVRNELQARGDEFARLEGAAADTLDLLAMLFEFLLDDERLPDGCRALLSYLHLPYLRLALRDPTLFTRYRHPARRLLNAMAQAAALYARDGDEQGVQRKIRTVVEYLLAQPGMDGERYALLLEDFETFVATLQQRAELREQRSVEAARGRERLLVAREQAQARIGEVLRRHLAPALISGFLEGVWCDVLTFIHLRQGEDSADWQRALRATATLAWGGTPQDAGGRRTLLAVRDSLCDELRKGLELLGGHSVDSVRRQLEILVACQDAVQNDQPQALAELQPVLHASSEDVFAAYQAPLPVAPQDDGAPAPEEERQLRKLSFGTWFEVPADTGRQRWKLSWFSPSTAHFMFVDPRGMPTAIVPLAQLARDLRAGRVQVLAEEAALPWMDRALQAIRRMLRDKEK